MRFAGVGIGTVQRELEKLAGTGLITVTEIDNQKHYHANRQSPIFEELRDIALKTFGLANVLREALIYLTGRIKVAVIYGSVAKGTDKASSDIYVMIVYSNLTYFEVIAQLAESVFHLSRTTINPTLYKPEDLARKRAEDNAFVSRVLNETKIFLIGTVDDLA